MSNSGNKALYEIMYEELGCQCDVDPNLGDILNENPDCPYHNWLEDALREGLDIDA